MIEEIQIRNFQSLQDIHLQLAPFTVVVGPSSSGKSAFIRALKALTSNRRGTDFITHGERTASISAKLASANPARSGTVTLTRSTQTAPNAYTLIPEDPAHAYAPKAEFTKLGGEVPAPISEFLGIPTAQVPLAIASQFDKPYLLDASGTEVARVLASLTNAHIVLNGARESNRQKLQLSQTLRTRADDLEAIKARVPEFRALNAQRSALEQAETLIASARSLRDRLESLAALTETVLIAEQRIPALEQTLASVRRLPSIDDTVTRLSRAQQSHATLTRLIDTLERSARNVVDAQALAASIPSLGSIDELAVRLSDARTKHEAYLSTIQAISRAQQAVAERSDVVTQTRTAMDAAQSDLAQAMLGIKDGFLEFFQTHGDVHQGDLIEVSQAAALAARYVATLDS